MAITAVAATADARGAEAIPTIVAEEHWAQKGDVKLYLYRKQVLNNAAKPVLFLVHGSSFSGRGGFDLQVPGHPDYSMMDAFTRLGFDVWTMDPKIMAAPRKPAPIPISDRAPRI